MKSIYDSNIKQELISRINTLSERSTPQWGKMSVYQMLVHNRKAAEMMSGKLKCKRVFIGRLFGKMALRSALKDDSPMVKNAPTSVELKVKEVHGDIELEKKKWIDLILEHVPESNPDFVHPFFGKMTAVQIGYHTYKHADHHLRQFNC